MGTEGMQNKPHGVPGNQAALIPSRYFQGSPVASCLVLACQAPGEWSSSEFAAVIAALAWPALYSAIRVLFSLQTQEFPPSHGGFRIGTYPGPALHIPCSRVSQLHLTWKSACGHWGELLLPPHQSLTPEVSGPTCGHEPWGCLREMS